MTDHMLREKALFDAVVDLSSSARRAHLDETCSEDPELRAGVERLLANLDRANREGFLDATLPHEPTWIEAEVPPSLEDFDDYRDIVYLGHGGMGVVYRAFDTKLQKDVALKMPLPGRVDGIDFLEEPQGLAQLNHPNIVHVHRVGHHRGTTYFTMNLVEKWDWADCRKDTDKIVSIMIAVAEAVGHAHQRGLVHRDLKPANIMMEDGNPRVTDFGLATVAVGPDLPEDESPSDRATQRYQGIVGSISYMSPEQADPNQGETTQSDVYGLGAVLYTLLTGRPPHKGPTIQETLRRVREESPLEPRGVDPTIDPDLETICLKSLAKETKDRYHSAGAFAEDLRLWQSAEKPSVAKWTYPYWLWRWCKRRPFVCAGVIVAILVVALVDYGYARRVILEREQQVSNSNAETASSVAKTVDGRLRLLSSAVIREAKDDRLIEYLDKDNNEALGARLVEIQDFYADPRNGLIRPGEPDPFSTWFLLDARGVVLGHASKSEVVGRRFGWRDYFRGALDNLAEGRAYISRVYKAHVADTNYKFGIAVPVSDGDSIVAVLVATVTTGSTEGLLLSKTSSQEALLVGRWDGTPPEKPDPNIPTGLHKRGQTLVLLHPEFEPEAKAVPIQLGPLLGAGEPCEVGDHVDPVQRDSSGKPDRWLAASIPVAGTEFVVIVQQRYDESVRPNRVLGRVWLLWGLTSGILLLGALVVAGFTLHRNRKPSRSADSQQL